MTTGTIEPSKQSSHDYSQQQKEQGEGALAWACEPRRIAEPTLRKPKANEARARFALLLSTLAKTQGFIVNFGKPDTRSPKILSPFQL